MAGQRWNLFADPRIAKDKEIIDLFNKESRLVGVVIPTGASAGQPELVSGDVIIEGHKKIKEFLMQPGSL